MFRYKKQTLFILIIFLFILNGAFAITSKPTAFISANAKNITSAFTLSNKVYLCELNIFKIIDVTDKSNIFFLSAIHLPFSSGANLVVSGNYAYVIGPSGFAVINV